MSCAGDATNGGTATRRRSTTWPRSRGSPAAPSPASSTAATTSARPRSRAVQRAIAETGYVVNQHARSLVTQRSGSVAFVLSEPQERLFEDPNFNVLLRGCTQALAEHDITLVLTIAGTTAERERVMPLRHAPATSTARCWSPPTRATRSSTSCEARGVPVVACGRPLGHERDIAYVAADDRDGARQMVAATCVDPGRRADRHDHRPAGHAGRRRPPRRLPRRRSAPTRPTLHRAPATTPRPRARRRWSGCWRRPPTWTRSSSPPT